MAVRIGLALLFLSAACVRTSVSNMNGKVALEGPLLVLVSESTFGTRQAERFAEALRTALAAEDRQADVRVVDADALRDGRALEAARAGKVGLLRVIPIAGTRLVGEVTRVTYDASLYGLPDEARQAQWMVRGESGALPRQLTRRDRRMAKGLAAALHSTAR